MLIDLYHNFTTVTESAFPHMDIRVKRYKVQSYVTNNVPAISLNKVRYFSGLCSVCQMEPGRGGRGGGDGHIGRESEGRWAVTTSDPGRRLAALAPSRGSGLVRTGRDATCDWLPGGELGGRCGTGSV